MKAEALTQIKVLKNSIFGLCTQLDSLKKSLKKLETRLVIEYIDNLNSEKSDDKLLTKIEHVKSTNCNINLLVSPIRDYHRLELNGKTVGYIYGEQDLLNSDDYLIDLYNDSNGYWEHEGVKITGKLKYIPRF